MKKQPCLSPFLTALCALVFLAQVAPAQEWADELSSLLDRFSDEVDGGYIEDVSIESETSGTVSLRVTFSGVPNSSEMIMTAQVLGVSMRAMSDCHAGSVSLPGPSGSLSLPLEYQGSTEAFSMFLRVVLFDRSNGTIIDTRRIRFTRRWSSGGAAGESALAPDEPAEQESTSLPTEEREPIVIEPRRVGNTPEIREEPEEPEEQPTETVTELRPREATLANVQVATATRINIMPNLFTLAPDAKWANDKLALKFGGKPNDRRGFAANHNTAVLNDNRSHKHVLQSHPRWFKNGAIFGKYEKLTVPKDAEFFETGLGFIRGGAKGDVNFVVTFRVTKTGRNYTLLRQRLRYSDGVVSKKIPLPNETRGQTGTLQISVHAGASSAQDWAVWINPRISN